MSGTSPLIFNQNIDVVILRREANYIYVYDKLSEAVAAFRPGRET